MEKAQKRDKSAVIEPLFWGKKIVESVLMLF
jgi:hypothetical protein